MQLTYFHLVRSRHLEEGRQSYFRLLFPGHFIVSREIRVDIKGLGPTKLAPPLHFNEYTGVKSPSLIQKFQFIRYFEITIWKYVDVLRCTIVRLKSVLGFLISKKAKGHLKRIKV